MPQYFPEVEQRSVEWLKLHLGRPTASGFDKLLTPKLEVRKGEMPRTYLYQRLAEKMLNRPLLAQVQFMNRAVEEGVWLEHEALRFFEFRNDVQTHYTGFVIGDDGRCGCSPDALIGDHAGLEIKCPCAETHLKYRDAGVLPDDYAPQVHGSLYVTGREEWHFLSYHRGLEPFHVVVKRDDEIMGRIRDALAAFYAAFDEALERLSKKAA